MAAIIALATLAGAVSGALATIGVSHFVMTADAANTAGSNQVLEESVSRIDADITAIKAGLDHAAKTAQGQLSKTNDRLDKIEKAQAEPTSKIAKMSEALDKLRAAQAAVPASAVGGTSVAAKDIRETGHHPGAKGHQREGYAGSDRFGDASDDQCRVGLAHGIGPAPDSGTAEDRGGAAAEGRGMGAA